MAKSRRFPVDSAVEGGSTTFGSDHISSSQTAQAEVDPKAYTFPFTERLTHNQLQVNRADRHIECMAIKSAMEANGGFDPLFNQRRFDHRPEWQGDLPNKCDLGPNYLPCGGTTVYKRKSGFFTAPDDRSMAGKEYTGDAATSKMSAFTDAWGEEGYLGDYNIGGKIEGPRNAAPTMRYQWNEIPIDPSIAIAPGDEMVATDKVNLVDKHTKECIPTDIDEVGHKQAEGVQKEIRSEEGQKREKSRLERIETLKRERNFNDQCFLFDNYDKFVNPNRHFENFIPVVGGTPAKFYNTLTSVKGLSQFVNARPDELSELVPYIRLWKVYYPTRESKNKSEGIEVEMPVKNYLSSSDISNITKNRGDRGGAIGIKSFNWELAGVRRVEAERLITANLVLYFQDINAIAKPINPALTKEQKKKLGNKKFKISYLDLINKEMEEINSESKVEDPCEKRTSVWNDKYYQIKIEVGWSARPGASLHGVVAQTRRNFYLGMVSHNVNFKDDATVEITLNCQAQLTGMLKNPSCDILMMGELDDIINEHNRRECQIDQARLLDKEDKVAELKKTKEGCADDRGCLRDLTKCGMGVLEKALTGEKVEKYKRFMEKVEASGGMYYADLPISDITNWIEGRGFGNGQPVDFQKDDPNALVRGSSRVSPPLAKRSKWIDKGGHLHGATGAWQQPKEGVVRMQYLYFGSILDAALSVLYSEDKDSNLRNIVGTLGINNSSRPNEDVLDTLERYAEGGITTEIISLADVPISYDLFQNWFYDSCIKEQRASWSLSSFIHSLGVKLFNSVFLSCKNTHKTVDVFSDLVIQSIELPLDDGRCPLTNTYNSRDFNKLSCIGGDKPFGKNLPEYNTNKQFGKYLFIGTESKSGDGIFDKVEKESQRKIRDEARGIYHLRIGNSNGLVKNIKFKKMENQSLKVARIMEDVKQHKSGLGGVAELYNATVDMIGNNLFRPGTHVFIDTKGLSYEFGSSSDESNIPLSFRLGFGGYYMIKSVSSSIASGEYTTSLDCQWVASGYRTATQITKWSKKLCAEGNYRYFSDNPSLQYGQTDED